MITHLSGSGKIVLIMITLFLSVLSWRYIEQPFKGMTSFRLNRTLVTAGITSSILVLIGFYFRQTKQEPLLHKNTMVLDANRDSTLYYSTIEPLRAFEANPDTVILPFKIGGQNLQILLCGEIHMPDT